jgi:hypothetical protein
MSMAKIESVATLFNEHASLISNEKKPKDNKIKVRVHEYTGSSPNKFKSRNMGIHQT